MCIALSFCSPRLRSCSSSSHDFSASLIARFFSLLRLVSIVHSRMAMTPGWLAVPRVACMLLRFVHIRRVPVRFRLLSLQSSVMSFIDVARPRSLAMPHQSTSLHSFYFIISFHQVSVLHRSILFPSSSGRSSHARTWILYTRTFFLPSHSVLFFVITLYVLPIRLCSSYWLFIPPGTLCTRIMDHGSCNPAHSAPHHATNARTHASRLVHPLQLHVAHSHWTRTRISLFAVSRPALHPFSICPSASFEILRFWMDVF